MRALARLRALLLLLPASAVFASQVPWLDLPTRASRADRVVLAEVVAVAQEADAQGMPTFTVTTLKVREALKGVGPTTVELRQLGGQQGAWRTGVVGDVRFERGEQAVLFLKCPDPSAPGRCALFGLGQGKLRVVQGARGPEVLAPDGRGQVERLPLAALREKLHGPKEAP